ncbi:MAG: tetratricopeptide repeat protein [Marinilabiliaceae bacterium]|nr:tetratricopeptide repeat protein [Marinilabiliaceae bacterium]
MKYFISIFLLLFIFYSCKTKESLAISKQFDYKSKILTEEEQRKFDIYFYEASREKMLGNIDKSASHLSECLRIDPTSSATMFELANLFLLAKKYDKAQELLEQAIKYNPDNYWYQVFLADLYQNGDEGSKAIKIYENLISGDNDNEEYLYMLAQLYAQNNEYQLSINTYNRLEQLVGITDVISLDKERLYVTQGKKKNAFNEVERLISKYPFEPLYSSYKGDLYLYYKDYENAFKTYNNVFSIDSTYDVINFSLYNLEIARNNLSSAKDFFLKGMHSKFVSLNEKIEKLIPFLVENDKKSFLNNNDIESILIDLKNDNPFDSRVYIAYADFLKSVNRKEEALINFKNAVLVDGGNSKIWEEILFLDIELGKFDNLKDDASEALKIFNDKPIFYYFLSNALIQEKKYNDALPVLKNGLKYLKNENNFASQFHALIADVYYELDSIDNSFIYYESAIVLNDKNIVALNNYSYYLSIQNKDLEKAEKMSSRCIELEPGNPTYLDTYAWVLFKRKRYLEAKFIIERAYDNGGNNNSIIVEHYGDIMYFNNDIEKAVILWIKSKEMGNESKIIDKKIEFKKYFEE